MKIVVVDHVYLEEEHIKKLQSIGDLEVFENPPKTAEELKERIKEADIVIVGWSDLTKNVIDSAKRLKMVSIWATTCHYADLEAAKERGIIVTHIPGYAMEAVAEHTFALLLAAIRKLPLADKHVRNGGFDWRPFGGIELYGKTLGIIGTGSIGCRVAEIAKAFKMRTLGYDKYPNVKRAEEIGMKYVDLYTLLKESDFITLHVTLTSETERLIGKKEIEAMKKGVVLINTSQGKVVDEKALVDALKSGKMSFAGLDVFGEEPPAKDNSLFKLDNTILSPHVGFHTTEAAKRCTDICIENVVKFLEGHLQNAC
ncbi:phosphoglycerate dehydrogenase [Candidatus Bathyarchaeota archaeon]|nr:phosphoglycerate dehydrogenase [Candidatus Bathyarchaeota archaeon]